MIVGRLLSVVKEIEPLMYNEIMKILLKINNVKLFNMLGSRQLLFDEVKRAKQYYTTRDDKDTASCSVAKAMASDEKYPQNSSGSECKQ